MIAVSGNAAGREYRLLLFLPLDLPDATRRGRVHVAGAVHGAHLDRVRLLDPGGLGRGAGLERARVELALEARHRTSVRPVEGERRRLRLRLARRSVGDLRVGGGPVAGVAGVGLRRTAAV